MKRRLCFICKGAIGARSLKTSTVLGDQQDFFKLSKDNKFLIVHPICWLENQRELVERYRPRCA